MTYKNDVGVNKVRGICLIKVHFSKYLAYVAVSEFIEVVQG